MAFRSVAIGMGGASRPPLHRSGIQALATADRAGAAVDDVNGERKEPSTCRHFRDSTSQALKVS